MAEEFKDINYNLTLENDGQKSTSNYLLISVIGTLIIAGLYVISIHNFLLFHSLAESFSIVIACGIFMVVWNSRRFLENNFFLIIGIAFLFISSIDIIHTLAYKGIDIFPGHSTNLPTQLWIAGRYLQASTLFVAPFLMNRKLKIPLIYYTFIIITSLIFLSIFYWRNFPICYVDGVGLTEFKKISEYVISLILVGSLITLIKKRNEFDAYILKFLIASIIIFIFSELTFTLYHTSYGFFNMMGHQLRIISYYLIYQAIFVAGFQNPFNLLFRKLKKKEEILQFTRFSIDHADDLIIWMDSNGNIIDLNDTVCNKLKCKKDELIGSQFNRVCPNINFKEVMKLVTNDNNHEQIVLESSLSVNNHQNILVEVEISYLQYGDDYYYCAFARDITERKKTEAALYESEARFRNLADFAPVMIWMTNNDKSFSYCNKTMIEYTGKSCDELVGTGWTYGIFDEDKEKCWEEYSNAFDKKIPFTLEYRYKRFDGEYRWLLNTGVPRFTPDGNFLGFIGSSLDITERKEAIEQIQSSLKEKVILLKEIHHRVKNNLQVISSLFRLQSTYIKDTQAKEIFNESQNRVRSMALIHEKLYLSKNLTHVNFSDYVHELVTNLLTSYRFSSNTIELDIKIDNIELNVDLAVNLGLILNELISNSLKHAFPNGTPQYGEKCELKINLCSQCQSELILEVSDNGIGFPDNIDFKNTESLGMQLVNSLVDQYKGEIMVEKEKGTKFTVAFSF